MIRYREALEIADDTVDLQINIMQTSEIDRSAVTWLF